MAIIYATDETFDSLVSEGVVLVDFTATWCGPCKVLSKTLDELEEEIPFINIIKVDVDQCPCLTQRFDIHTVPQVRYYKDGQASSAHEPGAVSADAIRANLAELLY